jgi:hypothetical protein
MDHDQDKTEQQFGEQTTDQNQVSSAQNLSPQTSGNSDVPAQTISTKRIVIIVIAAVAVVLLLVGGFLLMQRNSDDSKKKSFNQNTSASESTAPSQKTEPKDTQKSTTIKERSNDSQRRTDIKSIQTNLEVFYNDNGRYPAFFEMSSDTWRRSNLREFSLTGLPDDVDPDKVFRLSASRASYGYVPSRDGDTSCENAPDTCQKYTLSALLSSNEVYELESLN